MTAASKHSGDSSALLHCDASAKINLALHVTGQREDGFHDLETLAIFCEVGDRISVEANPGLSIGEIELSARGPFGADLPPAADNIVAKAARAMLATFPPRPGGLSIIIEKNLPLASGMGGGSADAAATLLAVANLYGIRGPDKIARLAETIGSDVPMCLHSCALIARGRGEAITLLEDFPALALVLVNPGVGVSTPQVFSALRQKSNPPLTNLPALLDRETLTGWLAVQRNDLEAPALLIAPQIGETLEEIRNSGALLSRMSGSGATCFGLYSELQQAETAALQIRQNHPDWWVQATRTKSHGFDRIEPEERNASQRNSP